MTPALLLSVAALMVATAALALALWSLKVSRDADINSRVLDYQLDTLRASARREVGDD